MQIRKYAKMQILKYVIMQIRKYANMQICAITGALQAWRREGTDI